MVINYTKWFGVVDLEFGLDFDALTFGALPDKSSLMKVDRARSSAAERTAHNRLVEGSIFPGPYSAFQISSNKLYFLGGAL